MKKSTFALIILAISVGNLSLEAAIANAPHNDSDLIAYGASVPEFKASVWINSGCSASRVKLSEDDSYDFYITAAHCISDFLSPNSVTHIEVDNVTTQLFKKLLEDGIFDLKNISCEKPANVQGKDYPSLDGVVDCDKILKWHALVRAAIDIGLIESCRSSVEDIDRILGEYVVKNIPLKNDDIVVFEKLKCIIHPSYENESGDYEYERDLAFCTTFEKNHNLSKYNLKFINDGKELEDKKLVSVSFGIRNTKNIISNMIPDRQAFNTLIKSSLIPTILEKVESENVAINESPTGDLQHGDSGGTLLFRDDDGKYTLVAVVSTSGFWVILDPQFIADAYEQLIKEAPEEVEKAEL